MMAPQLDSLDIVVRLAIAAGLAAMIGLEREARDQDAGLRTHILVAMGACLFVIVGNFGWNGMSFGNETGIVLDPSRVVAYVVTGIGFLGAGAILKFGTTVRGLTTAASLWVTAAIGVTSAAGDYLIALIATAMILLSLRPLQWVSTQVGKRKPVHRRVLVEMHRQGASCPIAAILADAGLRVEAIDVNEHSDRRNVTFVVSNDGRSIAEILDTVTANAPGVLSVSIEDSS